MTSSAETAAHLSDSVRLYIFRDAIEKNERGLPVIRRYKGGFGIEDILRSFLHDRVIDTDLTLSGCDNQSTRGAIARSLAGRLGIALAPAPMSLDQICDAESALIRERRQHREAL